MSECYYKFDLDINKLINIDYILQKSNAAKDKHMILVRSGFALKKIFYDYLKPYGLREYLMLFMQQPYDLNEKIHTDYTKEDTFHHYSFNILCKGQGTMSWYERPESGYSMYKHPKDPNNILYETYPGLVLNKLEEWTQGKVALVKTGIPHGVKNDFEENRVCLCIRIDDYGWDGAKKIFSDYLKNEIS